MFTCGPGGVPTIRDTTIAQPISCTDVTTLYPPESYEVFDLDPPPTSTHSFPNNPMRVQPL